MRANDAEPAPGRLCEKLRPLLLVSMLLLPESPAAGGANFDLETIFAPGANGRAPSGFEWSDEGRRLAFELEDQDGKAIWLSHAGSGETREVLRAGDSGEPNDFRWSPDGRSLLIEMSDDLMLLDTDSGSTRKLTETDAREEDPKFSPDGARLAFVRDADLWILDLQSGEERRLTSDGGDVVLNGKTDWVYWEELWDRDSTGHWWSPAGDRLAYYRFDLSNVGVYPLLDAEHPYPGVELQRYPKAGTNNPDVRVGVIGTEGGQTTWLETGPTDEYYLARIDWFPDGSALAVQRLPREQNALEILRCSPNSGECSLLHRETAGTWVDVTNDLRFLPNGAFLWSSDRDGWRTLEVRGRDGALLNTLVAPGWAVDHVVELVASHDRVIWVGYPTTELGARHRVVVAQSLSDGTFSLLSDDNRWASASASQKSGLVAIVSSTADEPASAVVRDLEGRTIMKLPSLPPAYQTAGLPRWRFLTIPGPDGSALPAALLEPDGREEGETYPAIMYQYGGPASQVVSDRWGSGGRNQWHKLMAVEGYAVLLVDNQGSNFFGKPGADLLHRRFGPRNLAAQLAGVRFLGELGFVALDRIGLWGWSGGGANTLYSVLNSPGTWRAGVAGAPVTNWYLYDTIWTERYLDHPDDNPDGYRDSSATTWASQLEDALLIVHGTADDNVHPHNTIAMSKALIAANKSFEQAIHPGQKHGFRDADQLHFYARMTDFFRRHLR